MIQPTEKFQMLLREAVSTTGSYDPDECLSMIEERLTFAECSVAERFLAWCHDNDKHFGSANFSERFAEWQTSEAGLLA